MDAVRSHVRASCPWHGFAVAGRHADRKLLAASSSTSSSMPIHARLNEHVNERSSRLVPKSWDRSATLVLPRDKALPRAGDSLGAYV